MQKVTYFSSPIGILEITANELGLESVKFENQFKVPADIHFENEQENQQENPILQQTIIELREYFANERKVFTIKLAAIGTDFQKNVWENLSKTTFGQTLTYSEFTKKFTDIKTIRAVASANGKNKIGIIVPCHRIIGKEGNLTGYAGELWRKKWLLEHEGSILF